MLAYKEDWERIYKTKQPHALSWTQDIPETSLNFIHRCNLSKTANIIDIGGGDSKLADYLLDEGFNNITVLDISEEAIEKAKQRLGNKTKKVKWIVSTSQNFNHTSLKICGTTGQHFIFLQAKFKLKNIFPW